MTVLHILEPDTVTLALILWRENISKFTNIIKSNIFTDFWERFQDSLRTLSEKRQQTVCRSTLVKAWNTEELENYAQLIRPEKPDSILIKGLPNLPTLRQCNKITKSNFLRLKRCNVLRYFKNFNFIYGECTVAPWSHHFWPIPNFSLTDVGIPGLIVKNTINSFTTTTTSTVKYWLKLFDHLWNELMMTDTTQEMPSFSRKIARHQHRNDLCWSTASPALTRRKIVGITNSQRRTPVAVKPGYSFL